ncbi:MAG: hypothetical protein HY696_07110 [Deltaproteobacteria bacterium]|nr:hypothetical protein [Deltaproteobacteria bacterium]
MATRGTKGRQRAERLEGEGDRLLAQGKTKAALKKFRAAEALGAERPELYTKLIQAHQAATTEWTAEDFTASLGWEMRRQELLHPEIRAAHERLSPEWREVTERLRRLFVSTDAALVERLTEEIAAYGGAAVRPLLDFLLVIKHAATSPAEAS